MWCSYVATEQVTPTSPNECILIVCFCTVVRWLLSCGVVQAARGTLAQVDLVARERVHSTFHTVFKLFPRTSFVFSRSSCNYHVCLCMIAHFLYLAIMYTALNRNIKNILIQCQYSNGPYITVQSGTRYTFYLIILYHIHAYKY